MKAFEKSQVYWNDYNLTLKHQGSKFLHITYLQIIEVRYIRYCS